jgi:hypothetical protein
MMTTCKMACVFQGIMLPHYFHNVNLKNYGLPHMSKSVTPSCVFTPFNNDEHGGWLSK